MDRVFPQKHGISALGLKRVLGLGSHQTASAMLHRFRAAMVPPGASAWRGSVEGDESHVGGEEEGATGRQTETETETKARVAIAVEVHQPKGIGRVRLQHIPDVSKASPIGTHQARSSQLTRRPTQRVRLPLQPPTIARRSP